jgi:hypothetical protein
MTHRIAFALALTLAFASACADPPSSSCAGAEGCTCVDGQCLGELVCDAGLCVVEPVAEGGDDGAIGSSSGDEASSSSDEGSATSDGIAESGEEPGGPRFLSFGVNTTTLLQGETLVFAAVLTDPDGVDDIIGGTLLDPQTNATYGAFATSASEGAYQATLLWTDLGSIEPIEGSIEGVARTFRAEFFDTAGHVAVREVTVQLDCPGETQGLCGGQCRDFAGNENECGGCDHVCFEGESPMWPTCSGLRCYGVFPSEDLFSCADVCSSIGADCDSPPKVAEVGYVDTTNGSFNLATCEQQAPAATTISLRCWCLELLD